MIAVRAALARWPVRAKILAGTILVVLLTTLFAFVYYPQRQRQAHVADARRRVATTAELIALGAAIGLARNDFSAVTSALDWARRDPALRYIVLVDNSGEVVAAYNPHDVRVNLGPLAATTAVVETRGYLQAAAPVAAEGRRIGSLVLGLSLDPLRAAIRRDRLTALAVSLGVFLVGLVLANELARRITAPIATLRKAADRVAGGDYATPIAAEALGQDEVGALGRAFETMLARVRRAMTALERSEAQYRELVEQATVGIYRSGTDGRFVAANPALVKMLGYDSTAELLELDPARDVYVHPDAFAAQASEDHINGEEAEWRRKDGSSIAVRLTGRCVRDVAGRLDGFEMIVEDVTERRALEAQLRQAQKMEAIGTLSGGIAHDFNNLLTAILANAELLRAAIPGEHAALRNDVEEIEAAAARGADMIRKLLGFSRRERLVVAPTDLGLVVTDLAGTLRRLLPATIETQIELEPQLPPALVDGGTVQQILLNLATNARDAMPEGGVLRVAAFQALLDAEHRFGDEGEPGAYVCLAVSDTGIGMDEQTRARAFEPFFTTKPQGAGTGLGLAMAYGLVQQQNGFIHIYSEPAQGTTVRLYLPLATRPAGAASAPASPARGGHETILVVEDEDQIRRAAKRVLERLGYRVLQAADGEEALAIFRAHEHDVALILTDVVMPRLGGPALWDALRQAGKQVRVLFSSGYTARDIRQSGKLDPRLPFVSKPWTVSELAERVRQALDGPVTELPPNPDPAAGAG